VTDNENVQNTPPEGETVENSAAEEAQEPETAQAAPVPDEAEEKYPYSVRETRDEEGSVKRYVVEVERSVLDEKLQGILKDLRKTVMIDGFRPGKAPLQLLKNRFGKDAQEDALKDLATNVGGQIVTADSLDAVSEPQLHESKVEEGQPVVLEVDIEVRPKIDATEYTDGEYEIEMPKAEEGVVERQVEQICQANATYEEPEDKEKAFEKGDGASVDVEVVDSEGKRIESLCQENVFMRDPFATLLPEVAQAMVGKKPGEMFTQEVERTVKNREGGDVTHKDTYTVTLREVKLKVVPALDDEFAKDVGDFENLEALRKRIQDDLNEQRDRQKRQQAMEKILDHIIETNPFAAPRTIVAAQEYQTIMRDSNQLQQMGLSFQDIGLSSEGYLEQARSNAERFVKINLLINAIGEKEKIEATDEDVDKEIERRAEAEGRKPLAIRARLEAEKQLEGLKRELTVQRVEDFLMAKNQITVKEVDPAEAKKAEEGEEKA